MLEYAVIIALITAGLIAMQLYLKRGIQGGLRNQSESLGEQYRPGHTTSVQQKETAVNTTESSSLGLSISETEETTKQTTNQKVQR